MLHHKTLHTSLAAVLALSIASSASAMPFPGRDGATNLSQGFAGQSGSGHGGGHGGGRQASPGAGASRDHSTLDRFPGQERYRSGEQPSTAQRRDDARPDRDSLRRAWRAGRQYDAKPYVRPNGWYARDWGIGDVLPALFRGNNYWLDNYWLYDLPIPPIGCIWVRDGSDALLIDRRTGEIISVIYDLFY